MRMCNSYKKAYVPLQWRQNGQWRPKSAASQMFTQPFIQAQIKENIKAPRHWPLFNSRDKSLMPYS